jgi:mannose-6-phosphate isomerase-like protein (cupin superfamily)
MGLDARAAAAAPKPERIRADWAARGFSFGIWEDPPGQVWADFVHAQDELVLLAEGAIEIAFGGRTLRPSPGEEVLIPAGASHTVVNIGKTPNRWYYGYRRR